MGGYKVVLEKEQPKVLLCACLTGSDVTFPFTFFSVLFSSYFFSRTFPPVLFSLVLFIPLLPPPRIFSPYFFPYFPLFFLVFFPVLFPPNFFHRTVFPYFFFGIVFLVVFSRTFFPRTFFTVLFFPYFFLSSSAKMLAAGVLYDDRVLSYNHSKLHPPLLFSYIRCFLRRPGPMNIENYPPPFKFHILGVLYDIRVL